MSTPAEERFAKHIKGRAWRLMKVRFANGEISAAPQSALQSRGAVSQPRHSVDKAGARNPQADEPSNRRARLMELRIEPLSSDPHEAAAQIVRTILSGVHSPQMCIVMVEQALRDAAARTK